ncbi:MAG: hypothetical protein UT50_C0007G0015 [Candidatus Moranbacteria bacterium GW2011_GWA2_39_41]|nr:MAG: hypothetical protein UT50_C0007G0015 [Candidatus Moranbacteria bacterium GW2011_GWA2_39_41]
MLYQIIPPILIILSLAGIVIFFMKKAPQIASLEESESLEQEKIEMLAEAGFFRRSIIHVKNIRWDDIKHFLLIVLEKLTRKARIMFLKLESQSKNLSDSIRTKRNSKLKPSERNDEVLENIEEDDIINKVKNYQLEKKVGYLNRFKKTAVSDKVVVDENAVVIHKEEKVIRPTVSDRVVTPQARTEMKDRLEDLLIERIAANPKDTEAYERLGEYYMEIDSLNDAKECFKQVLKLDPKNRNVRYRMKRLETIMHKR